MGEGEGGMISENGIETGILSRKKRIASLCSIQDTGCLGLVHGDDFTNKVCLVKVMVMTQRDVMGREVGGGSCLGTHVHPWWIHVNVRQNQYSIVK